MAKISEITLCSFLSQFYSKSVEVEVLSNFKVYLNWIEEEIFGQNTFQKAIRYRYREPKPIPNVGIGIGAETSSAETEIVIYCIFLTLGSKSQYTVCTIYFISYPNLGQM